MRVERTATPFAPSSTPQTLSVLHTRRYQGENLYEPRLRPRRDGVNLRALRLLRHLQLNRRGKECPVHYTMIFAPSRIPVDKRMPNNYRVFRSFIIVNVPFAITFH